MKKIVFLLVIVACYVHGQAQTNKQSNFETTSKSTEMESVQIVNDFLAAVMNGNHDRVNELVDANIHWEQPGNNPYSGSKKSLKEVYEMVGGMSAAANHSLKMTSVKTLAVNGNSVAALVNWKATKSNGEILDIDNIDVYTIEKGKIVKATVYSADIEKENKYWAN